ncbi:hypothetical protein [Propylenella binzhouense]|uniref:hypothetical protein n=1 Tax=Propylenella binzhouense TaxID=2555902 RepID=UPI001371D8A3|nr:hypothetical protein [Propylenella binzhouense]
MAEDEDRRRKAGGRDAVPNEPGKDVGHSPNPLAEKSRQVDVTALQRAARNGKPKP